MSLRVNGELIAGDVLREEERQIRPRMLEAMAHEDPKVFENTVREWARENVIERVLLRQEAATDTEAVPAAVLEPLIERARAESPEGSGPLPEEALRREVELQYRAERLIASVTEKAAPPKNKEVSDFYVRNKDEFRTPETVHAAHIVKNLNESGNESGDEAAAQAAIEEAERRLKEGVRFEELADELSDCPGRGGDLGFFARGQMVDEFEQVVFSMQPGQVSGIFRSPFGFHIAKVYEFRPAGQRPLHEVRDEIAGRLLNQKKQKLMEQFLDRLRAKAVVEL